MMDMTFLSFTWKFIHGEIVLCSRSEFYTPSQGTNMGQVLNINLHF